MAGGGTALKHTPFYPNSDSPLHSLFLIHPALSDTVLLSEFSLFFRHKTHAGRRAGGEEKQRVGGDERGRKQRKLVRGARGEKRGRPDGGKEGRKGSFCLLKCAIKGFCINKQRDESKLTIKRGVTGASPRCVHADKTATVRAETDKFCVSPSGFYSSCSSNFREVH